MNDSQTKTKSVVLFTLIVLGLVCYFFINLLSLYIEGNIFFEVIASMRLQVTVLNVLLATALGLFVIFNKQRFIPTQTRTGVRNKNLQVGTITKPKNWKKLGYKLAVSFVFVFLTFNLISFIDLYNFYFVKPHETGLERISADDSLDNNEESIPAYVSASDVKSMDGERNSSTQKKELRVAFFNKNYKNYNFELISKGIQKVDPDIIGLSEFYDADIDQIDYLKNYEYRHVSNCKCKPASGELAIFSKYEIGKIKFHNIREGLTIEADIKFSKVDHVSNLAEDNLDNKLIDENKVMKFFVTHPAAPISNSQLNLRNDRLVRIRNIVNHSSGDDVDYKILVGDFNTSQWSTSYSKLENYLQSMYNSAQGKGIQFTWNGFFPGFAAQIDHIFVTNNVETQEFNTAGKFGSDHQLIYADLLL